jgi:hypothetical protein
MNRVALALGLAALLIPVSMLLGLSAWKSIVISLLTGGAFLLFSWAMSRIAVKKNGKINTP